MFFFLIAPILTFETVVAIIREINFEILQRLRNRNTFGEFRNHIVIAGVGKLGNKLAKRLHEKNQFVTGVDINDLGNKTYFDDYIIADISDELVQYKCNFKDAKLFFCLTPDDIENYECCKNVLLKNKSNEKLKCVAQINDVYFKSCLTEKIEDKRLILLNSYDLVSKTIINLNKGLFSDNTTNVIIAGFGNLGKMFLFNLPQILDAEKFNIIIIDKCKELKSQFEIFSSLNELNISCNLINNDIKDKVFWEKIFKDKQSEENIVIFLCTDDDTSNISTSLFLSKLVKENNVNVNIISRYFKEPKFLNDLISRQDYENKKIMSFTLSKIFEEKLEELIN